MLPTSPTPSLNLSRPSSPHRSYYLLVSLSALPAAAYAPLLAQAVDLPALLAAPAPHLPHLASVLGHASPLQLAGAAVFLAGNALQCHSHWLLARLGGKGKRPGYKIPRGAWGVPAWETWEWWLLAVVAACATDHHWPAAACCCQHTAALPPFQSCSVTVPPTQCLAASLRSCLQAAPLSSCPARTT